MADPDRPIVREAVARFADPEKLEAAISELQSNGFDRADISFLAPAEMLSGPVTEGRRDRKPAAHDPAAPRGVPGTSLATVIAGFAATGFTVATGGATPAAAGESAVTAREKRGFARQLERGGVLVWVRTRGRESEARALGILRRFGGREVHLHDVAATA